MEKQMMKEGFLKVAAATPRIRVADRAYNSPVGRTDCRGRRTGISLCVFPELVVLQATPVGIYSCSKRSDAAEEGLTRYILQCSAAGLRWGLRWVFRCGWTMPV